MLKLIRIFIATTMGVTALLGSATVMAADPPAATSSDSEKITPYSARFGRSRPVIAVIGENRGTELIDFVIPYGVLARSGAAEVISVATQAGTLKMRPALQIQPQATIAEFDTKYPDGADYLIVPAVVNSSDPTLLAWVAAQGAKGATVVSICDGALVVANSGLMKGHRATGHWYTHDLRTEKYPDTTWLKNIRYVADGKIVSSAGISAAMPTSLALVEAIAGHDKAATLAQELGVSEWGTQHDSDIFHPKFGVNLMAFVATNYTNTWFHSTQSIGVPIATGVDEIALALTADAYTRTGRSRAYTLAASAQALLTQHGLIVIPDKVMGGATPPDRILPPFETTPPAKMLDKVLAGIADIYGKSTAYGVALDFEYPGFKN